MVCNRHNIHQEALLQITRPLESLAGFFATFPSVFALENEVPWGAGARMFSSSLGVLLHEILHQHDQDVVQCRPSSETQGQIVGARESLNGRNFPRPHYLPLGLRE